MVSWTPEWQYQFPDIVLHFFICTLWGMSASEVICGRRGRSLHYTRRSRAHKEIMYLQILTLRESIKSSNFKVTLVITIGVTSADVEHLQRENSSQHVVPVTFSCLNRKSPQTMPSKRVGAAYHTFICYTKLSLVMQAP